MSDQDNMTNEQAAADLSQKIYGDAKAPQLKFLPLLQFFSYAHLPAPLQDISRPFCDLAYWMASTLPVNPESTTALRRLLEAKDCAVRAFIYKEG